MGNGGVVLNFGSNVILPEVFLKALNLARNLGYKAYNFTAANFDMLYHYRPAVNVVCRPTQDSGKGYYITGHHEIMLPLSAPGNSGEAMKIAKLKAIIQRFPKARVLVLRDLILDEFIWGKVERISPEAPVPVVLVNSESFMPGGATNVASNIASLGGGAYLRDYRRR